MIYKKKKNLGDKTNVGRGGGGDGEGFYVESGRASLKFPINFLHPHYNMGYKISLGNS